MLCVRGYVCVGVHGCVCACAWVCCVWGGVGVGQSTLMETGLSATELRVGPQVCSPWGTSCLWAGGHPPYPWGMVSSQSAARVPED